MDSRLRGCGGTGMADGRFPRVILRGMKLHNYFRSSASFRVRIALALKGLTYEYVPVHLARGDHKQEAYASLVPDALVPMLEIDGLRLSQSMAIIEYLDETRPSPPLMPATAAERARVRALAQSVACEIHPLNNLRVLRDLVRDLKVSDDDKNRWYRHWVETGLEVVERQLMAQPATYCHGETPTLADCVLVPQIFNAQRFECRLDHVPQVMRVFEACMKLPAFQHSRPEVCPDAE
jgi:maleylacetoacetate isomerase/maleylpyruvate isomerase